MKRSTILFVAAALLAAPSASFAHEYDRDDSDHPLRYIAYAVHPVGVAVEKIIIRPLHWFVSSAKWRNEWFGHYPHPKEGWSHIASSAVVSVAPEAPAAPAGDAGGAGDDADRGDFAPSQELLTVYFDYDKSDVRADQLSRIDENLRYLLDNPELHVIVEGHCDERGTIEYNYALGERRAKAVRAYLVKNGVAEDRVHVVSKGEEEPAAAGSDEAAWSQNRRAEFEERQ